MSTSIPSPFQVKRALSAIGQGGGDLYAEVEHLNKSGFPIEIGTELLLNCKVDSLRSIIEMLKSAVGNVLATEMISLNAKNLIDLFETDESRFRLFIEFLGELKDIIPTLISSGDFIASDFTSLEKLALIRNRISSQFRTSECTGEKT